MRSRMLAILGVMVLILGGAAYCYHTYLDTYHGYDPLPFSREAWLAADAEHRGYMLNDLLEKHVLVGMSQEYVIALLGPPDGSISVAEMIERYKDERSPDELRREYGEAVEGRLSSMYYDVGYMGGNPNAAMVFSYILAIDLKDGTVTQALVGD